MSPSPPPPPKRARPKKWFGQVLCCPVTHPKDAPGGWVAEPQSHPQLIRAAPASGGGGGRTGPHCAPNLKGSSYPRGPESTKFCRRPNSPSVTGEVKRSTVPLGLGPKAVSVFDASPNHAPPKFLKTVLPHLRRAPFLRICITAAAHTLKKRTKSIAPSHPQALWGPDGRVHDRYPEGNGQSSKPQGPGNRFKGPLPE